MPHLVPTHSGSRSLFYAAGIAAVRFCLGYCSAHCRTPLASGLTLALLTLASGCGPSGAEPWKKVYPAAGKVRFGGQAIEGAVLILFPKDKSVPANVRPTGTTELDGSFELGTYSVDDGAPAGEYDVAISWRPLIKGEGTATPGPNRLPEHYGKPETSQLTIKIDEDTSTLPTIELKP
ncbi:MAG: hypothetical protein JWM11_923 [Planctomycetaceae bacterium]|nr:hypothetical protein [Planctomycetaceae bacterium]